MWAPFVMERISGDMEMDIFTKKVCVAVEEELGKGFHIEVKDVRKNNGVILHGMIIMKEGLNVAPTIYLDTFLEAYESGATFRTIVQRILETCKKDMVGDCMDMGFFQSFEKVRDKICYRLIGREKNKELLEDIPYIEFLDLAICFYYAYQGDALESGTILIHNSHVELWKSNVIELLALASRNTRRLFPCECSSIEDVLKESAGGSGDMDDLLMCEDSRLSIPMKILSNSKRIYGAVCLLYPGVLAEIAEKEGSNFYILPSSIHETILLPDDGTHMSDALKRMISEVNSTQVAAEEVLSDSLYYFDSQTKRVSIVRT